MSSLREKRSQAQAAHSRRAETLRERLVAAGEILLSSNIVPPGEPYDSLVAEIEGVASGIGDVDQKVEQIQRTVARVGEIRTRMRELEERRKKASAGLEPMYEALGEAAFRVYRSNPLVDQDYSTIFSPLLDCNDEIREAQRDLEQREGEVRDQPFLEKMVTRGKIVLLRNRIANREASMRRLYRDAGQEIVHTDFVTSMGDPSLDAAAGPLLDRAGSIERIDTELGALGDERGSLTESLERLTGGRRPQKRLDELAQERTALGAKRMEIVARIAEAAREAGLADGEELEGAMAAVDEAAGEVEESRVLLERLEAGLEVERLTAEIASVEQAVARKERQVETLRAEIADMSAKVDELRVARGEQETLRGSLSELTGD